MVVAPINDAIDAVWELYITDRDHSLLVHHNSMLTTLEFLQTVGFNHVSLEEHKKPNNN